jgi:hypothetical protein
MAPSRRTEGDRPAAKKLPAGAVKISIILLRKPDGLYVVDGKATKVRPIADHQTVEKCVYAVESWIKTVARGMRLGGKVAPKVIEAFENVGAQAVETAAGALFQRFFGKG